MIETIEQIYADFNPLPRKEGDISMFLVAQRQQKFQSTPS